MFGLSPQALLKLIPAILVGLTEHELAHAWVALRLGDDTPRLMGRVSLNPLKHVVLLQRFLKVEILPVGRAVDWMMGLLLRLVGLA